MSVLIEVDWFVPMKDMYDMPSYRVCDFCSRGADDDVIAGKTEDQFRQFFEAVGEDGLVVCEHCLPKYYAEETA